MYEILVSYLIDLFLLMKLVQVRKNIVNKKKFLIAIVSPKCPTL